MGNRVWISHDEGANIMMATMALQDSRRRVTLSGHESHSKRARMTANDSDNGESSRSILVLNVVLIIFRGQTQRSHFVGQAKLEEYHH